jgi:hypothetical protein
VNLSGLCFSKENKRLQCSRILIRVTELPEKLPLEPGVVLDIGIFYADVCLLSTDPNLIMNRTRQKCRISDSLEMSQGIKIHKIN